jgi:hypothetical protein
MYNSPQIFAGFKIAHDSNGLFCRQSTNRSVSAVWSSAPACHCAWHFIMIEGFGFTASLSQSTAATSSKRLLYHVQQLLLEQFNSLEKTCLENCFTHFLRLFTLSIE